MDSYCYWSNKGEDPTVGIKPEHKMSVRQAKKELAASGFKLVKNGTSLPLQHFLLFEKTGENLNIPHSQGQKGLSVALNQASSLKN